MGEGADLTFLNFGQEALVRGNGQEAMVGRQWSGGNGQESLVRRKNFGIVKKWIQD